MLGDRVAAGLKSNIACANAQPLPVSTARDGQRERASPVPFRLKTMRMPELALPPPAAWHLLREGTALGVWRLCQALHPSAGGQWYWARHALAADQFSAVLVLAPSERAADVMLRFADQAAELGRLAHAAIAVPTDSGVTAGGQPYLIVEAADSVRCEPILAVCASLSLRERLNWLVQLCEALRYAHQQGWLLGDIDPAMLWIDSVHQRPLLMGMGLVRMPDPCDPSERGMSLGASPGYQAPELLAGQPPSLSSEAYGLGALLSMLVEGRLPVLAAAAMDLGLTFDAASQHSEPGDLLRAFWPLLSRAEVTHLQALLARAAAPLPAERHLSAEALADDLRDWLALSPPPSPLPLPASEPVTVGVAADPAATNPPPADIPHLHSHPLALPAVPAAAAGRPGWLASLRRRWRIATS